VFVSEQGIPTSGHLAGARFYQHRSNPRQINKLAWGMRGTELASE